MPNLLDCPQEIQDMIYKARFTAILAADAEAPIHEDDLLRVSPRVGADAIQVRCHIPLPASSTLSKTDTDQVALAIMHSEIQYTDSSYLSTRDKIPELGKWACSGDGGDFDVRVRSIMTKWQELQTHLDRPMLRRKAQERVLSKLEAQAKVLCRSKTDGESSVAEEDNR